MTVDQARASAPDCCRPGFCALRMRHPSRDAGSNGGANSRPNSGAHRRPDGGYDRRAHSGGRHRPDCGSDRRAHSGGNRRPDQRADSSPDKPRSIGRGHRPRRLAFRAGDAGGTLTGAWVGPCCVGIDSMNALRTPTAATTSRT